MKKYELVFGIKDLVATVSTVINMSENVQIIALKGTLGAGKTTFAIELLKQLGVCDEMQSPTYTYMQMYKNGAGKSFYHFDLYRLQDKNDFLFAGFDEFLYQPDSLTIIEWPEIIESLFDRNVCVVELNYIDDVTRRVSWNYR